MSNKQYITPQSSAPGSGGGGGGVTSVSGTAGQIDSTGGTTPVISIDPAFSANSLVATVTMSAAQFLAMDNTAPNAKVLVAAPGAGLQVIVESLTTNMRSDGVDAYGTGTGNLGVYWSNGATLVAALLANYIGTAALQGTTSLMQVVSSQLNQNSVHANQAIVFALSTATKYTSSGGADPTFSITLRYRIVSAS